MSELVCRIANQLSVRKGIYNGCCCSFEKDSAWVHHAWSHHCSGNWLRVDEIVEVTPLEVNWPSFIEHDAKVVKQFEGVGIVASAHLEPAGYLAGKNVCLAAQMCRSAANIEVPLFGVVDVEKEIVLRFCRTIECQMDFETLDISHCRGQFRGAVVVEDESGSDLGNVE